MLFKGVDPCELVRLDFWEENYLRKLEIGMDIEKSFNKKRR
jgi:hypothetical protein